MDDGQLTGYGNWNTSGNMSAVDISASGTLTSTGITYTNAGIITGGTNEWHFKLNNSGGDEVAVNDGTLGDGTLENFVSTIWIPR